ncbi:peptidylprolyl isomerase [Comamonas flocculans]|uniref:peptidylprolyl isomerase n=1 Tax=Comamonas flocculans TaxID=2597701 RepID=A0A5B8RYF2_9BURK|nr:peptidylprolyl isomerase [Comamonas flocculans]QEA13245.1 peptidylprolyl isomerase [Comamonas flocculans]
MDTRSSKPTHVVRYLVLAVALSLFPCLSAWAQAPASVLLGEGPLAVTTDDILAESAPLQAEARKNLLTSASSIERMAADIYLRRQLSARALEQKIDQQPEVQRVLQLVRERVLADALVKQTDAQHRPAQDVVAKLALEKYNATPQRFEQPERLHLRHILIPAAQENARLEAENLREQIINGADFETLAREKSKDPGSASKGGDLGFVGRGKMVAPFEEAAFALSEPKQLSPVVETQFGFHVIQLVEKKPAGLQPFEEVKSALEQEASAEAGRMARQALARPILAEMQIHTKAIEAFADSQK